MHPLARRVALLLFGSGTCALIYEIAWFREFRLVFGASTSANAAVLAVFVGGLGAGGLLLGKYADRAPRPVLLYAKLEMIAAALAALTPALLWITRKAYIAVGGSASMGSLGATVLRLLLTMVVLFAPTFVMGGTLPAAVRGIETEGDPRRRGVGLLYGCNTLGAVFGCVLANFVLLEAVGTRWTLWLAAAANFAVALAARSLGQEMPAIAPPGSAPVKIAVVAKASEVRVEQVTEEGADTSDGARAGAGDKAREPMPELSPAFVLGASAAVGFAFFLMELVWYRMLGPLLGGTVFTFGIILAVALFGIGLGGACYAFFGTEHKATLAGFALTCLLEAFFIALPYAMGDQIATIALLLRPLGTLKFSGLALSWTLATAIVVLPASFVSGVQFPLLIALLGQGRDKVGSHTGLAYAANTGGAIAGALAGGFGLLPALTVLGSWRLVAWLLGILGVAAGLSVMRRTTSWLAPLSSVFLGAVVIFLLQAEGPTAVWRHGQIGVGRAPPMALQSLNNYRQWKNMIRRAIKWEGDGQEITVGLDGRMGWAFITNGKSDGHARIDAPTQVMVGLLGALFYPGPVKHAMVIGLGTGSTAGWLGALPDIERVDVAELEPAVLHVAEVASDFNHNALKNPKLHVAIGDARETLLTSHDTFDIIASEPSNPYRAGVASLYTREYYQAIKNRLAQDGIFLQWLQAYDVDNQTIRTVYATLGSVFPEVETWELEVNDLLLVASRKKIHHELAQIRERLTQEPFRSAFRSAWRAIDAEGVFGHFVARGSLAKAISFIDKDQLNTDDRNVIEFGFARTIKASGEAQTNRAEEIREVARSRGEHRPPELEKELDWDRVADEWIGFRTAEGNPTQLTKVAERQLPLAGMYENFLRGDLRESLRAWRAFGKEPRGLHELAVVAEDLADTGDEAAFAYIERLRELQPTEASAILGRLRLRQEKYTESAYALDAAFRAYRTDGWAWPIVMTHALETAGQLLGRDANLLKIIRPAIEEPFVGLMLDETRRELLLKLAVAREPDASCAQALSAYEPYTLWQQPLLSWRVRCYEMLHHADAVRAAEERDEYERNEPARIEDSGRVVHSGR